jgi:hypothetical protein
MNDRRLRIHRSEVMFNPETRIPTAILDVECREVSQSAAREIIGRASPHNWHVSAPEFFEASEVGVWTANGWKREGGGQHRSSFQLLEWAKWSLSPEFRGGAINVLDIDIHGSMSNVNGTASGETEGAAKVPSGATARCSVRYDYRLHHCIQTQFLSTWEPGGIDVDEGTFSAIWEDGTLRIVASKSIHYTEQGNVPPEMTALLNALAPGVANLLLQCLILGSSVAFVRGDRARRDCRAPPRVSRRDDGSGLLVPTTGGFPGFDLGSRIFFACARVLSAQANVYNDAWANVRAGAALGPELIDLLAASAVTPIRLVEEFWRVRSPLEHRTS